MRINTTSTSSLSDIQAIASPRRRNQPWSMDPEYDDSIRVGGFSLGHVIAASILLGIAGFIIYILWNCSCKKNEDQERQLLTPGAQRIETKAMYAMELEPGIVLLQSQDGDFFRILHEYDAVKNQRDRMAEPPSDGIALQGQTIHYIPHYTRAHMQTQATAPQPASDDVMPWTPLTLDSPPPAYH